MEQVTALLVALACINHSGCDESMHAYYQSSPELQQTAKYSSEQVQKRLGASGSLYLAAVGTIATGQDAVIPLTTHISAKGNFKWQTAGLSYSYYF